MIQDLPDAEWMHRKDIQWAYDAITDLDLTFDALGFAHHVEPFQRLFDARPKMRIVIDHCMKPVIREDKFDRLGQGHGEDRQAPRRCSANSPASPPRQSPAGRWRP